MARKYDTTLAAGGTQTATLSILAPDTRKPLGRLIVDQTAGSAASFTVEASTDSTFADETKFIVKVTGCTTAAPCDVDNGGRGFLWHAGDDSHLNALNRATCRLYVRVTPASGSDNAYSIRALFGEE